MNEARNLASLPFNVVNRLRSNLDTTRQLIAQARGLAFDAGVWFGWTRSFGRIAMGGPRVVADDNRQHEAASDD